MTRIFISFCLAAAAHLGILLFFRLPQVDSQPMISGSKNVSITLQTHLPEVSEVKVQHEEIEPIKETDTIEKPVMEEQPKPQEVQQPEVQVAQVVETNVLIPLQISPRAQKKSFPIPQKKIVEQPQPENIVKSEPPTSPPIMNRRVVSTPQSAKKQQKSAPAAAPSIVKATPNYQKNPKPIYPAMARRRGWQGTVLLAVTVLEDGSAEHVKIQRSCNYEILDEAALKAVREWKFIAGTQNGIPQRMKVLIPVHFHLK